MPPLRKIGSSGGFKLAAAPGKITECDAASFERPGIRQATRPGSKARAHSINNRPRFFFPSQVSIAANKRARSTSQG